MPRLTFTTSPPPHDVIDETAVVDPFAALESTDEEMPEVASRLLGYDVADIARGTRGDQDADQQIRTALRRFLGWDLDDIAALPSMLEQALADVEEGRTFFAGSPEAMFEALNNELDDD